MTTTPLGHQNRYEELSDSDRHLIDRACNSLASGYTVPFGTPIGTDNWCRPTLTLLRLLLGETLEYVVGETEKTEHERLVSLLGKITLRLNALEDI